MHVNVRATRSTYEQDEQDEQDDQIKKSILCPIKGVREEKRSRKIRAVQVKKVGIKE